MSKMTSGPGWSLSSDEKPPLLQKLNPASPKPRIRLEKRVGKYVTTIAGLHTYGADRLNNMARELKPLCGAGGTVKSGVIEIQGDKAKVIQAWFEKRGLL